MDQETPTHEVAPRTPAVGDKVVFVDDGGTHEGTVTHVHSGTLINLELADGTARTSVQHRAETTGSFYWWDWPPSPAANLKNKSEDNADG